MENFAIPELFTFSFLFCVGMALINLYEAFQAYPLLLKSNRKQKLFGLRRIPRLEKKSFLFFSLLLSVLLFTVAFEFLPKPFLSICLALYFLVYGQLEFLSRKTNLYPFVLFFLLFIPFVATESSMAFNGDEWTALFIKTTLSFVYFSSFIQKMKNSRTSWLGGKKISEILQYHDLLNETNWSSNLGRFNPFLKSISIIVLLFEAFFWVSIFFPAYDYYFGTMLIIFHLINLILFKINYLWYYWPILLIYFI